MKIKRFLSFAIVFCLAFAVAATVFGKAESVSVNADYLSIDKVFGCEYDLEYLLKDAGVSKAEGKDTFAAGRTVKYQLIKIGDENVAADDENYSESAMKTAGSTVKFLRADATYKFYVTDEEEYNYNFYVKTAKEDAAIYGESDISFVKNADKISAYKAAVAEYVKDKKKGDTFKFSELEEKSSISTIVASSYFDITKTKVVVHYFTPGSSSETTASGSAITSASFTLSKLGEYAFYFTFTDALNNATSVEDLVLGQGGYWTDKDEDGEIDYDNADADKKDELVVPVYSFEVTNSTKPSVAVGSSPDAFIDLAYSVKCFTITATNYSTDYKLYYIPQDKNGYYDKDSEDYDVENNGDALYIAAVLANADKVDVTEKLNESSMTFTPDAKGYYYVLLTVSDDSGSSDSVMSRAIACTEEYKTVEPEKQFFKYNTTSIVFLSISAVSFIAIIVLLFIKPKDKKELVTKNDDKQ